MTRFIGTDWFKSFKLDLAIPRHSETANTLAPKLRGDAYYKYSESSYDKVELPHFFLSSVGSVSVVYGPVITPHNNV